MCSIVMRSKVKTPWYSYYDGIREHLEYPDISLYELLEQTANNHLDNISYNYFGTKKTYKQFLKQIDDCAKSFKELGIKHNDKVIENIIDSHLDVLMSCVIGIDHPYKVQVAKAFIVLKNGIAANDDVLKSIKEHCENNLAKYSWPFEYEFRDELPKTLVGKVAFNE